MPTNFDNLSVGERHHLRYWTAFCEYMAHSKIGDWLEPQPKYWIQFPKELFGRGNTIRLGAHNIIRGEKYISVVLHLSGPEAKQRFDSLTQEKEHIEREIGARLDWRREPGIRHSEIILELPNVDPENERDWPRQHAWLKEKLEDFYRAFAPRASRF
jgi:Domain of unknown function (DUF4268)